MKKHNGGYSLIEILVAISILAVIVVPTCTGMVMSFQMNAKANQLMQAELAVSSAVEELMAEGIREDSETRIEQKYQNDRRPVEITITDEGYYCKVSVTSKIPGTENVAVDTEIRKIVETTPDPTQPTGGVG